MVVGFRADVSSCLLPKTLCPKMPPKAPLKASQELPSREQNQFKDVVVRGESRAQARGRVTARESFSRPCSCPFPQNLYEKKQFKKAIKIAEGILKSHPEHASAWPSSGHSV